ncbi:hypothetical protein BIV25_42495 [Streptomyces sp. MUSC 14]|nr:hypothetical protein BIV25_42495 [Streptomyces sp. MUSC 14]
MEARVGRSIRSRDDRGVRRRARHLVDRRRQFPHHPAYVTPLIGEPGGEEAVLADRQQLAARIVHAQQGRDHLRVVGRWLRGGGAASPQYPVAAQQHGLRAVQVPQRGPDRLGQARLGQQGQLAVEDDTGRPAGHGGRRRSRSDTAAGPDRDSTQLTVGQELLQQDEGAQLTDPAAALATPGYQPPGTGTDGGAGLPDVGDLRQHPVRRRDFGHVPWRVRGADDHLRAVPDVGRSQHAAPAHAYSEGPRGRSFQPGQFLS